MLRPFALGAAMRQITSTIATMTSCLLAAETLVGRRLRARLDQQSGESGPPQYDSVALAAAHSSGVA